MNRSRYINLVVALALVLAALPLGRTAQAEGGGPELARDMQFVPGEAVVGFEPGQDSAAYTAQATALADAVGAQVVEQAGELALMSFAPDADVAAVVEELAAQDGVAFAEPNYVAYAPDAISAEAIPVMTVERPTTGGETLILTARILRAMRTQRMVGGSIQAVPTYPNDFSSNWSWVKISTDVIWPDTTANPTVCVVDTGVDDLHPDLKGYVIKGQDYVDGDLVPTDDNGHGTHVAGTIAARMNNGAATVAGISTGKVLAVKVLNAQGLGTSFDINLGIRYCASHGAKIINLSLGSASASQTIYDALKYAEVTKGLLVVAAAGNGSSDTPFFPAAWGSSNICKDGTASPCAAGNSNNLASGLLSVAAARSLETHENDSKIWVDAIDDDQHTADEDVADCATDFSNYGTWVSMVAPGEDIFSTTPKSNPFYMNYYDGVPSGYAALSGTSMAAAHVSGAASRVWSIGTSLFGTAPTRSKVKTQLVSKGTALTLMDDPNANGGYEDGGYTGDGPFCWPSSMSSATYLNVASAMQRMSIGALLVLDANTGLPLSGAKVTVNKKGTSTILDTAQVSTQTPFVDLLNVPAHLTQTFEVKISKSGYITGTFKLGEMVVGPGMAGSVWVGDNLSVAVPKIGGISVVASWFNKQAYVPIYGAGAKRDLDLYMWTPANGLASSPSTITKGIVGPKESQYGSPGLNAYTYFGSLLSHPFARSFFDGGSGDANPTVTTAVGFETINIKQSSTGTSLAPGLQPYYYTGNYVFILTDNGTGKLTSSSSYQPMISVWVKGARYKKVTMPGACVGEAWKGLTLNRVTYTLGNTASFCGDYTALWPYP
jgi:subtilisin family serine protease